MTSCMIFVAPFPVPLVSAFLNQPAGILGKGPSKASVSPELQKVSLWEHCALGSPWLACFSLQDSNVESCSKKWRKERAEAEIERFLSKIARAWIILFSRRFHYLRAWHRLPRKHSFATYQSPHDDTGQLPHQLRHQLRKYQHRQPRQNRVDQHSVRWGTRWLINNFECDARRSYQRHELVDRLILPIGVFPTELKRDGIGLIQLFTVFDVKLL